MGKIIRVVLHWIRKKSEERETDLVIEANELFAKRKHLLQDINRVIRRDCKRLSRGELQAIQEAGRAGFVLGYLEGKKSWIKKFREK